MAAYLIPIQQFDLMPARPQTVVHSLAQSGFASGAETSEPDRQSSLGDVVLAGGPVGFVRYAPDHSGRDRQVRHRVDQNERPSPLISIVLVTEDRFISL